MRCRSQDLVMSFRFFAFRVLALSLALASPVLGQTATSADVAAALRLSDTIGVMQEEGIAYGEDLEAELFPGAGGARWDGIVALIYDRATMEERFMTAFSEKLAQPGGDLDGITAFFGSERGQRILSLEIEARRALLDESVEEAAQVAVQELEAERDPRFALLEQFAEANDLVEENVSGALNANLAFYKGMSDGGAFRGAEMTEDEMLSEVWSQEDDIRAETVAWLYPYLMLAYEPLSDEDMAAYIAFSESEAGATMNRALFAAYDTLFQTISHDLGRAAAEMLSGQDI
jgi:hypothetical protein